jgi:hypothetical protein
LTTRAGTHRSEVLDPRRQQVAKRQDQVKQRFIARVSGERAVQERDDDVFQKPMESILTAHEEGRSDFPIIVKTSQIVNKCRLNVFQGIGDKVDVEDGVAAGLGSVL